MTKFKSENFSSSFKSASIIFVELQMQFIEAQDAPFNCSTFIAIVKLKNPHRKLIISNRSFQFFIGVENLRYEIWSEV